MNKIEYQFQKLKEQIILQKGSQKENIEIQNIIGELESCFEMLINEQQAQDVQDIEQKNQNQILQEEQIDLKSYLNKIKELEGQIKKIEKYYQRRIQKIEVMVKREVSKQKLNKKIKKFIKIRPWKALNVLEKEACYSDTSTPYSNYSGYFSELDDQNSIFNLDSRIDDRVQFIEDYLSEEGNQSKQNLIKDFIQKNQLVQINEQDQNEIILIELLQKGINQKINFLNQGNQNNLSILENQILNYNSGQIKKRNSLFERKIENNNTENQKNPNLQDNIDLKETEKQQSIGTIQFDQMENELQGPLNFFKVQQINDENKQKKEKMNISNISSINSLKNIEALFESDIQNQQNNNSIKIISEKIDQSTQTEETQQQITENINNNQRTKNLTQVFQEKLNNSRKKDAIGEFKLNNVNGISEIISPLIKQRNLHSQQNSIDYKLLGENELVDFDQELENENYSKQNSIYKKQNQKANINKLNIQFKQKEVLDNIRSLSSHIRASKVKNDIQNQNSAGKKQPSSYLNKQKQQQIKNQQFFNNSVLPNQQNQNQIPIQNQKYVFTTSNQQIEQIQNFQQKISSNKSHGRSISLIQDQDEQQKLLNDNKNPFNNSLNSANKTNQNSSLSNNQKLNKLIQNQEERRNFSSSLQKSGTEQVKSYSLSNSLQKQFNRKEQNEIKKQQFQNFDKNMINYHDINFQIQKKSEPPIRSQEVTNFNTPLDRSVNYQIIQQKNLQYDQSPENHNKINEIIAKSNISSSNNNQFFTTPDTKKKYLNSYNLTGSYNSNSISKYRRGRFTNQN